MRKQKSSQARYFATYIKKLFTHANLVISIVGFTIGIIAMVIQLFIPSLEVKWQPFQTVPFILWLIISGFRAWTEEYETNAKRGDPIVTLEEIHQQRLTWAPNSLLQSPVEFHIPVRINNTDDEQITVCKITKKTFVINSRVFSNPGKEWITLDYPGYMIPHFSKPFEIEKRKDHTLYWIFKTRLLQSDPVDQAKNLREIGGYEIELEITFRDMDNNEFTVSATGSGKFDWTKSYILREWRGRNLTNLVDIASTQNS